jgi:hypothetical protein
MIEVHFDRVRARTILDLALESKRGRFLDEKVIDRDQNANDELRNSRASERSCFGRTLW